MDGTLIPLQRKIGLAAIQVCELFWRTKNNVQIGEGAARATLIRCVCNFCTEEPHVSALDVQSFIAKDPRSLELLYKNRARVAF